MVDIKRLERAIRHEYEKIRAEYSDGLGENYSRDEVNYDDGYVSALDWVLQLVTAGNDNDAGDMKTYVFVDFNDD